MADIKGILGTKLGMTQIFEDTRAVPVTVIKAGPCFGFSKKTAICARVTGLAGQ